jgi:hypothetical protein
LESIGLPAKNIIQRMVCCLNNLPRSITPHWAEGKRSHRSGDKINATEEGSVDEGLRRIAAVGYILEKPGIIQPGKDHAAGM